VIYDYAIEPELVATWGALAEYRFFADKFGLGTPRILAEFPRRKNWRRRVLETATSARLDGLELSRVTALVNWLSEVVAARQTEAYDGQKAWLANAETEHARRPFHAILARQNPSGRDHVITGEALYDPGQVRLNPVREVAARRVACELASQVGPMLRICSRVVFVDPRFRATEPRFTNALRAYLVEYAATRDPATADVALLVSNLDLGEALVRRDCAAYLPRFVPRGMRLRVACLGQRPGGEKLHNRYILTDVGGVKFGVGLDEHSASGSENETDDISLLSRELYVRRWEQYAGSALAFDLVESFEVTGTL
jgi:hypothetical protein